MSEIDRGERGRVTHRKSECRSARWCGGDVRRRGLVMVPPALRARARQGRAGRAQLARVPPSVSAATRLGELCLRLHFEVHLRAVLDAARLTSQRALEPVLLRPPRRSDVAERAASPGLETPPPPTARSWHESPERTPRLPPPSTLARDDKCPCPPPARRHLTWSFTLRLIWPSSILGFFSSASSSPILALSRRVSGAKLFTVSQGSRAAGRARGLLCHHNALRKLH